MNKISSELRDVCNALTLGGNTDHGFRRMERYFPDLLKFGNEMVKQVDSVCRLASQECLYCFFHEKDILDKLIKK